MVERVALFRSSTSALITITVILTITFVITFMCSQSICSFSIWMILLIICCFVLLPIIILRKKRNEIKLSGPSLCGLYRLLKWAKTIQIIQGKEKIIVKDHFTISDTTIKWYDHLPPRVYDVVDGIKAGDTVLVDGAKLIII